MNSLKAILGGFFAIIIMGLLAQLGFLFINIGYFYLVKKVPSLSFLAETTTVLLFIVTALIAFTGGRLTAKLAQQAVVIHCLVVAILAGTVTLIPSLVNGYAITLNGVLFMLVFLLSTVAGGLYANRQQS